MKKLVKVLLIIVISLAIIVYGGVFLGHKVLFPITKSTVPTIPVLTDNTFTFGPQAHLSQPKTIEDYISVLAEQMARYNKIAPELWPGNALVDQSAIVESLKSEEFWMISPDGTVTPLTKNEVLNYGISRAAYINGFSFYEGGVYLAVDEESLTNYLTWQRYLHLGTYDPFLFYTHEGFHKREQPKWQIAEEINNRNRNSFEENIPARAKRVLLQKQLMKAVSQPGDTAPILDALATYVDWKKQFPDDYKNSVYFDRIEGTANYFEIVTGLCSGYPDQIINKRGIDRAFKLLATREDAYLRYGLIKESYTLGAFACALLDRIESDWKERLMKDPTATPIEMLLRHFNDESLPAPQQITREEINAVTKEIQKKPENRGMPLFFTFLYDILF